MKKRIAAVVMAAVMTVSAAVPAFAGTWSNSGGNWYFSDSDSGYTDEILTGWQWIDGYCYYLDPDAGGAMAIMTVTPDGFPVNEVGRMTDTEGEPYYIPGWGLSATTPGPADYMGNTVYAGYSDYDDLLSELWDLIYGNLYGHNDKPRMRDREPEEPRRNTPDTVVLQIELIGGQPDNGAIQPDKPEDQPDEVIEQPEKIEEQPQDSVITAGNSQNQSQEISDSTGQDRTERPSVPQQRGQIGAGSDRTEGMIFPGFLPSEDQN